MQSEKKSPKTCKLSGDPHFYGWKNNGVFHYQGEGMFYIFKVEGLASVSISWEYGRGVL